MRKKRHISTLSAAAKGVTALMLLGGVLLFAASIYSLCQGVCFVTVCFFLLMAFALYVAVRTTLVQLRVGVDFTDKQVEFHMDEEPVCIAYDDIVSVRLLENGEEFSSKTKVLLGGQMVFALRDGGLRIVALPRLRVKTAKHIVSLAERGQKGEF